MEDEQALRLATSFGAAMVVTGLLIAVRLVRWLLAYPRTTMPRSVRADGVHIQQVGAGAWRARFGSLLLLAVLSYLFTYALAVQVAFPSYFAIFMVFAAPSAIRLGLRALDRWRRRGQYGGLLVTRGRLLSTALLAVAWLLLIVAALLVAPGIRYSYSVPPDWWWQNMTESFGLDVTELRRAAEENGSLGPLAAMMILTGLVVAIPCPLLIKWARSEARLHAAQLRRVDSRGQILYLRGFGDDRLRVKALMTSRRPTIEAIWPTVTDRWESVLADISDQFGPVVSIARPGRRLVSLGAAREYAPPEGDWLDYVISEARKAQAIVVSLGETDGVVRELQALRSSGLLDRSVLVMPPVKRSDLASRWTLMCDSIGLSPTARLLDPASILAVHIGTGQPTVFTARRRDEASYRAAVRPALEAARS